MSSVGVVRSNHVCVSIVYMGERVAGSLLIHSRKSNAYGEEIHRSGQQQQKTPDWSQSRRLNGIDIENGQNATRPNENVRYVLSNNAPNRTRDVRAHYMDTVTNAGLYIWTWYINDRWVIAGAGCFETHVCGWILRFSHSSFPFIPQSYRGHVCSETAFCYHTSCWRTSEQKTPHPQLV